MIIYKNEPIHTYIIRGDPIPWKRAALSGKTFYDAQRPIKNQWAISLEYQSEGQPFYKKTPLHLIANFYHAVPPSWKPQHKKEKIGAPYIFKGDLDNLVKFVLDNCNAILFDDDCTIYKISAAKLYSLEAKTEFALIPMDINGKVADYHSN
jgi:Holliday junction resolvase RusA-like endonuclease